MNDLTAPIVSQQQQHHNHHSFVNSNNVFTSSMNLQKVSQAAPVIPLTTSINPFQTTTNSIVDVKKKKARLIPPSIRLELNLEPPDSEKFTEFNYNKLILKTFKCFKKQAKKDKKAHVNTTECTLTNEDLSLLEGSVSIKRENINDFLSMYRKKLILSKELDDDERINGNNGDELQKLDDDQLDEDNSRSCDLDDDMENGSGGDGAQLSKKNLNRKKVSRNIYESDNNRYKLRDFAHLGKGYDENDSFIDNSDAVDVHVPSNMAPKRGGFYVNKEQIKLEKIDKKCKRKSKGVGTEPKSSEENDAKRDNHFSTENEYVEGDNEADEEEEDDDASYDSESYDSEDETDSFESSDEDDDDEDGNEEEENQDKNEQENESNNKNNLLKVTNSKKRELDTSSSCSNSNQLNTGASFTNNTNNTKEVNTKKRIRKLIEDDSDEDQPHKNVNNTNLIGERPHESSKKLIKDEEQRNQSINNKENSNIEKSVKLSMLNASSGAVGPAVNGVNSGTTTTNNNNPMGNLTFDPSENKLNKKKKLKIHPTPIGDSSTFTSNTTTSSTNMLPVNFELKKKKLEPNTNLNVLNAKPQPQLHGRAIQNQDVSLNSNEIEKESVRHHSAESNSSEECIIIDSEGVDQPNISTVTTHQKPPNLSPNLDQLTNNLIEIFNRNKYEAIAVWPNDFKAKLLTVYTTSQQSLSSSDKSAFYNYLAGKLGKTKGNLLRIMRRIAGTSVQSQQPSSQSNTNLKSELAPNVNQAQSHLLKAKNVVHETKPQSNVLSSPNQKIQISPQSTSDINLNSVSDLLRANLVFLEKIYKTFKLKNPTNDETDKFYESTNAKHGFYNTEKQMRANSGNNKARMAQIKDFCLTYLGNAFETNKEILQKRFDKICFEMKTLENAQTLSKKLDELKIEIGLQMEISKQTYANSYDKWVKSKPSPTDSTMNASTSYPIPKQTFEWSIKTRDLLLEIIRLKLTSFRSILVVAQNRNLNDARLHEERKNLEREKFIKDFLTEKVLVLWPDGWMSLNILYNRYISFRNQASPSNRSNESVGMVSSGIKNNQNSPNNPNVINISSKNGKTVRIEAQNVNQTQTAVSPFVSANFKSTPKPSKLKMDILVTTTSSNTLNQTNPQQIRSTSSQSPNLTLPIAMNPNIVMSASVLNKSANQQTSPSKQSSLDPTTTQFKSKQSSSINLTLTNSQQPLQTQSTPKYLSSFHQPSSSQTNNINLNNSNMQQQINNKQIQSQSYNT